MAMQDGGHQSAEVRRHGGCGARGEQCPVLGGAEVKELREQRSQ